MKPRARLDVSVVFDRNEDDIEACLESLFRHRPDGVRMAVTVMANRGRTPLVSRLESVFPEARIVINDQPRGFAENHNRVLRSTRADYVLVLNDDVILLPDSVSGALEFMERPENRDVAVMGPRLLNPDGSLQPSTYRFPTVRRALLSVSGLRSLVPFGRPWTWLARVLGRGDGRSRFWGHDRTVDVDTFRGAFMLARGDAVRRVGPMVEVTRAGVEEVEWHYRMRRAGWRVVFHPGVEVIHRGGRTISLYPELRHEHLRGFLHFFARHRSVWAHQAFALLAAMVLTLRSVGNRVLGRRGRARLDRAAAGDAWAAFRRGPGSGVPAE